MRNFSRYLLVGLLMPGMTGNTALANHWIQCMGCAPVYQPVYVEMCPPVQCCPPVDCCHESSVGDEYQTAPPAGASEYHDPRPTPSDSPKHELVAPPEAAAMPEHAVELPENSIVNKPAPMEEQTEVSPPPVTVPQPSLDDFEAPAASEATAEPEADSLFDAPVTPAPEPMPEESVPEDTSAADLFDEPTATEDSPVEVDPLDDLMPPTTEEMEDPADPAPEDPAEEEDPSLDDLFGQQQILPVLSEPGGLASRVFRKWTDDGARFHCDARLQQVTAKTVVLLKNNGKRIAVYFSRLSEDDLQFVHRQVAAHHELLAQRAVSEQLASR